MYGVAFDGVTYVAVGDTGRLPTDLNICVSTNGTNWTTVHSTSAIGATLLDIACGGGLLVAIGANHSYVSGDGQNWTQFNIAGGSSISYGNGIFIVPLQQGTNLVS